MTGIWSLKDQKQSFTHTQKNENRPKNGNFKNIQHIEEYWEKLRIDRGETNKKEYISYIKASNATKEIYNNRHFSTGPIN